MELKALPVAPIGTCCPFTGGVASTELNEGDPISANDPSNGYGQ